MRVVVVGGGHNGLVCAAYLARAGLRPVVVERRAIVGGAAVTGSPWGDPFRLSSLGYALVGGSAFGGEMTLHQLFHMRPTCDSAGYQTPIRGLYLAGSGSHPGGGITGIPGHNAARRIIAAQYRPWRRGDGSPSRAPAAF